MHITVLYNSDHDLLEDDPGREARKDVTRVAAAICEALDRNDTTAEPLAVGRDTFGFVERLRISGNPRWW
jgi:D-alanine-D-alanine ligase